MPDQSVTIEAGTETVHDWDAPIYTWSADNKTVTATRTCKNNPTHIDTETVDVAVNTVEATCDTDVLVTYMAVFTNIAFAEQTKTEQIPAIGHMWNAPTYEWSEDNKTVTATSICKNDPDHVEFEMVKTTSKVTREATCDEKGVTTYTAIFAIEAFSAQTADVENIDAIGHDWDEGKVTKEPALPQKVPLYLKTFSSLVSVASLL